MLQYQSNTYNNFNSCEWESKYQQVWVLLWKQFYVIWDPRVAAFQGTVCTVEYGSLVLNCCMFCGVQLSLESIVSIVVLFCVKRSVRSGRSNMYVREVSRVV